MVAAQIEGWSRARAQSAIEAGQVRVNDRPARKPSQTVPAGATIDVDIVEDDGDADVAAVHPVDLSLPVLYEDDACIVINKPAGISVHPGAGMAPDEATILHGAAYLLQERSLPFSASSVLVHRLDKDTTGCLLLAKTSAAHSALQKQFEGRSVSKHYLAIVAGIPSPPSARIEAPIGRSPIDRTKMSILSAGKQRDAATTYTTVSSSRDAALLLCELHTGRTHQIRVHLTSVGYPLLGDDTYVTPHAQRLAATLGIERICLHAWKLAFASPAAASPVSLTAPVPDAFAHAAKRAGLALPPESFSA